MFRKKNFVNNKLFEVGVSIDTDDWLFGVDVSIQHPEILILIGFGLFNFYIVVRGEN